jgi:hypothetical protein
MKELCDHTAAAVQQPYEVSYLSECIVMNSHSLIEPLVADCLIGSAGGRSCLLVSGFLVANLDVSRAFCRMSGRLIFVAAWEDSAIFVVW